MLFFFGLLFNQNYIENPVGVLKEQFPTLEFIEETLIFFSEKTMRNYYAKEMGDNLKRILIFAKKRNDSSQEDIVFYKKKSIELENNLFSVNGKRFLNIDIGLLSPNSFWLSSSKEAPHRLFLQGIFLEQTLYFYKKEWQHHLWTYLDYKCDEMKNYLKKIRKNNKKTS